jgi:hypothetical protein
MHAKFATVRPTEMTTIRHSQRNETANHIELKTVRLLQSPP